ncbi:IKI3-domain-containing protein [Auricularia subglabra TFB-10046 SS5]|nr:IKI3-domain-containing protein [Auricularia subglabra TFB-10046 SS5]
MITSDNKMLLMTQDFEVLSDAPIQTEDFGEEQAIDVGWGSKSTQFHGSLGKTAAQQAKEQAAIAARGSISPDDDRVARVSWRGDGAYYVVSSLDRRTLPGDSQNLRRVLRVYNRLGALQTTSEPVPGLEHPLSWRPSGSLIASTQRFGFPGGGAGNPDRHDILFFERNGLRHGEFTLREPHPAVPSPGQWAYKVRQLTWSCDSSILAVWIERTGGDVVQLWTMGNYHWYLKHEISANRYGDLRFTCVAWHSEDPLRILLLTESKLVDRRLAWDTFASRAVFPFDTGMVAVIDGAGINLTPFRTQNVPPPMSSHTLQVPAASPPVHVAFGGSSDSLAAIWETGLLVLWDLQSVPTLKQGKACSPEVRWQTTLPEYCIWQQVSIQCERDGTTRVAAKGITLEDGADTVHTFVAGQLEDSHTITPFGRGGRVVEAQALPFVWQSPSGELCALDTAKDIPTPTCAFPEFCPSAMRLDAASGQAPFVFVGLGSNGALYAACEGREAVALASNCSSFAATPGFLIYTTTAHEAVFVTTNSLQAHLAENAPLAPETRRVERGSRIVTAVPSAMSLVLQMPRGNLETIYPRPLVLEVVRRDITAENYKAAFVACRKHRIDLNILVEHDREAFMRNIPKFVDHVSEVDHLNLVLAGLGRSGQSAESIGELCDAIRGELERRDIVRYVNTILTAHVVKTLPNLESALSVLLRLRETEPAVVEDAAKYIIFLVDAERLFDTALGMYDFSLVLLIAQFSQKDPREYLPLLRELRAFPPAYQRFRIDEHLKRHERALGHLAQAGDERFAEALAFVEKHRLFVPALGLWPADGAHHKALLDVYGDYLFERKEFAQAALAFETCGKPDKALVAHERALSWRELFALATALGKTQDETRETARRVGEGLSSKRRYAEAATVYLDYADDVDAAVHVLVEGNEFAEAQRLVSKYTRPDLLESSILPGTLEAQAQTSEAIGELREQLAKQRARLDELAARKDTEPEAFYGTGEDDAALHNVDVMTDASAFTAFTRYTKAPTSASVSSRVSRRTSKSKRKLERKAGSGRKGTVDEERYLLTSIGKLCTRLATLQVEVEKLQHTLVALGAKSAEHEEAARALQNDLSVFEKELGEAVEHVWKEERMVPAVRLEEGEVVAATGMIKIDKPLLEAKAWRVLLLDAPVYKEP